MGVVVGALALAVVLWYWGRQSATPVAQVAPAAQPTPAAQAGPTEPSSPSPAVTPTPAVAQLAPVVAPTEMAEASAVAPAIAADTSFEGAKMPTDHLIVPVQGVEPSALIDTYNQKRGSDRIHEALDIMAAKGTPVLATADGTIKKLFKSVPGGLTIYEFDPSETFAYYYAHLDSYAADISEGKFVKQGQIIGYVGSTGNANASAPHLHFAIFRLNADKHWWQGTAINPYPLLRR